MRRSPTRSGLGLLAVCSALLVPAASARADAVTEWNQHATTALMATAAQPPQQSMPHMAMVHGAVLDAVNAPLGSPSDSKEAAVATAAHDVLVALVPAQAGGLDAKLATSLAGVPDGPGKTGGVEAGHAAAAAMLAERANDGRFGPFRFSTGMEPGVWRPVLPAFVNDPNAWLKDVKPFVIEDPAAYRSDGPLPLDSPKYAKELNEVKAVGASDSTERTADQTHAARYWAENPPATWSRVFRTLSAQQHVSLAGNARLFAMLYMAGTDALIAVWDDKAVWLSWRPITAIREAASDGNPRTQPQAGWTPLIPTPPYPDEPSGHAGLSGAIVKTLQHFFGTDDIGWTDTTNAGLTRSFSSFSQAIAEIVDARVWSGIHFRTSDVDGQRIGRAVANEVWRRGPWR